MTAALAGPWWRDVTRAQWKTLLAAQVGWMLDAMDVMLYAVAMPAIQAEFRVDSAAVSVPMSVTLLAAAAGGMAAGFLADRFGRARMLMASILVYSVFTAAAATSQTLAQLVVWRLLVGIGMGGEWTAGALLVAESWPAQHRGKAIGIMQSGWAIGYILAAALAALVLPTLGWRWLFALGAVPALFVAWIRRSVPEPEIWRRQRAAPAPDRVSRRAIFRPPLAGKTVAATILAITLLSAYWGLFTWIPAFLAKPAEEGGAGLGIVKSVKWLITMQVGAFFGYTCFGWISDRFGRRPAFLGFVLGAAVLVPVYGHLRDATALFILGPVLGFVGHGYFSVFGSLLAEIFPSSIRGFAHGLTYNTGRAVSALAPFLIGTLARSFGIGPALAATSFFYVAGAATMLFLPETRGEELT